MNVVSLWNKKREELEHKFIQAALDLAAHTGASSFSLPVPGTNPLLHVSLTERNPMTDGKESS